MAGDSVRIVPIASDSNTHTHLSGAIHQVSSHFNNQFGHLVSAAFNNAVCLHSAFRRYCRFLPIVGCYMSFLFMIYSTLRMFHMRNVTREKEMWRRLLVVFSPNQEGSRCPSVAPVGTASDSQREEQVVAAAAVVGSTDCQVLHIVCSCQTR